MRKVEGIIPMDNATVLEELQRRAPGRLFIYSEKKLELHAKT